MRQFLSKLINFVTCILFAKTLKTILCIFITFSNELFIVVIRTSRKPSPKKVHTLELRNLVQVSFRSWFRPNLWITWYLRNLMVSSVSKNVVSENVDGVWPKNSLRAMARQVPDPWLTGPSFGPLFGHFFWTILNFSPKAIRASRLRAVV